MRLYKVKHVSLYCGLIFLFGCPQLQAVNNPGKCQSHSMREKVERLKDNQGRLLFEVRYDRKGLRTGLSREYTYSRDGSWKCMTGYHKADQREGRWTETDSKGNLIAIRSYRSDTLDGLYKTYHPGSRIETWGYYKWGKESGKWYTFSVKGYPESEMIYYRGYRHTKYFYPNRKIHSSGMESIRYDDRGVMTACYDGFWTFFDEQGNKSTKRYNHGAFNGVVNFYDRNNRLERQLEKVGLYNRQYTRLIQYKPNGDIYFIDYHDDKQTEISREEYEAYKKKCRNERDTPCKK